MTFGASPMPDTTKGEVYWNIERADGTGEPQKVSLTLFFSI